MIIFQERTEIIMKKDRIEENAAHDHILDEYGRRKLLTYADSIRELADTYEESGEEFTESEDRTEYVWQHKFFQNKNLMAEHLKQMSEMMKNVAEEKRNIRPLGERRARQISHALKEVGMELKSLYMIETETGRMEFSICLKNRRKDSMSSEEIGDLLSVLFNIRLTGSIHNPFFTSEEYKTFLYVEEADYHTLCGEAVAVKEGENISGDNYAIFETVPGNQTMALSDGMGSGEKASADSGMVVELIQKFLESGFLPETAISMINSCLVAGEENSNLSTLDLCSIDLYSGDCRFVKVGSSSSYLKRNHLVERISAGNLPLGIFQRPDMEVISRKLQDGDYIIMISDGVVDALSQGMGEEILPEFIGSLELENPNEMAGAILNFCIRQSKGHIRDDMTVLVMGIWKKEVDFEYSR